MALDYSFYLHPPCNIYFGIIFANFCHLFFATPTEIDVCVCVRALSNRIFYTHVVRRYHCCNEPGGDDGDGNGAGQCMAWDSLHPSTLCACVISQTESIRLSLLFVFVIFIFKRGIIKKWLT